MDTISLNYITTIANEKSMSKAAKKLFVTPSALSQCVKKIETEIGTPIFERFNGHLLQLTESGRLYVSAGEKILRIKNRLYRELEDIQNHNRGSFIFCCSPKKGLQTLGLIYPKFHKRFPNVQINLHEEHLNNHQTLVAQGIVDIALITSITDHLENLTFEYLDSEEIVLAVPSDHHLLKNIDCVNGELTIDFSKFAMFKDEKWMLTSKGTMSRNFTNSIFEKAQFIPKNILLETSSAKPHIPAINAGIAVSILPLPKQQKPLNNTSFVHFSPKQYRNLYIAYRSNYLLSEAQIYFIDLIKHLVSHDFDESLMNL